MYWRVEEKIAEQIYTQITQMYTITITVISIEMLFMSRSPLSKASNNKPT